MPDSATMTVIIGGVIAIIGALVAGVVKIIQAIHETKQTVLATKNTVEAVTADQNQKLDNITVLVDGRYSDVLNELADMKEMFAQVTGSSADQRSATEARSDATKQEARLDKADKRIRQQREDTP